MVQTCYTSDLPGVLSPRLVRGRSILLQYYGVPSAESLAGGTSGSSTAALLFGGRFCEWVGVG